MVKGFTDCSGMSSGSGSDAQRLVLLEGQLTWIVYIIGAVIRSANQAHARSCTDTH